MSLGDQGRLISPSQSPGRDMTPSTTLLPHGCAQHTVSGFRFEVTFADNSPAQDERSRRRGCSDLVDVTPPCPHISDSDDAEGGIHPVNTPPTPNEEPLCNPVPPPSNDTVESSPQETTGEEEQLLVTVPTPVADQEHQPTLGPIVEDGVESEHRSPSPIVTSPQPPLGDVSSPLPTNSTPEDSTVDTGRSGGSTTSSVTTGVFKFDMPSTFIIPSAVAYLETIPGGPRWIDMVNSYLQLKQLPTPKKVCIFFLPSDSH